MDTSLVSCVSYSEEQVDTQETPEKTVQDGDTVSSTYLQSKKRNFIKN